MMKAIFVTASLLTSNALSLRDDAKGLEMAAALARAPSSASEAKAAAPQSAA